MPIPAPGRPEPQRKPSYRFVPLAEFPGEREAYERYVREVINDLAVERLDELADQLRRRLMDQPEQSARVSRLLKYRGAALTDAEVETVRHEIFRLAVAEEKFPVAEGAVNEDSSISRLTGLDGDPPPVEKSRRYGKPGGHNKPLVWHQQDVELSVPRGADGVPVRFPDLRGRWLNLINDGGPQNDLARGINCVDVVMSLLDTWMHGRPRVAAPRTYDRFTYDGLIRPLGGEPGGANRIEAYTGGTFRKWPTDRRAFADLEAVLRTEGSGSCAVLVFEHHAGGAHAMTVHNQDGEIIYVDAQRTGAPIADPPLNTPRMDVILLNPNGHQVNLGTEIGHWAPADHLPDPEGAPLARSRPGIDPEQMFRDPAPEQLAALGTGGATIADLGLREEDVPEATRAQLPRVAMLRPAQIGYTQRSVSPETSDQITAEELEHLLQTGGWRGTPVHVVLWGNGELASLDHRRVRAAERAGIARIPAVVHAPSDPIAQWGEPGEALPDDLRRLPDGSWVLGGDEGDIVYPKGTRPTTCGEAAVFRAASQRSLLPGHLFGTRHQPVKMDKPPGPARTPSVGAAKETLQGLLRQAESGADTIQRDLESAGFPLVGTGERIKSYGSLARKFKAEGRFYARDERAFAEAYANDVLRFTVEIPEGNDYLPSLLRTLEVMGERGHEVTDVKNFWAPGNRYFGVNSTLRSPSGQLFELKFATSLSIRADALTHELYEIVRRRGERAERQVHAQLNMIAINRQLDLSANIPPGLSGRFEARDNGLPHWISGHARKWDKYVAWLAQNERSVSSIVAEFGLGAADFPISPKREVKLRIKDADLLRSL